MASISIELHEEDIDDPNSSVNDDDKHSGTGMIQKLKRSADGGSLGASRKRTKDNSTCTHCIFYSIEDFNESTIEKDVKNGFVCVTCGKSFSSPYVLNRHKLRHNKREDWVHECSVCAEKFVTKIELTRHKSTHDNQKNFTCTICGQTFLRDYYLKEHMNCVHKLSAHLICGICNFETYRRGTMKKHLIAHSGVKKQLPCHLCKSVFANKRNLKEHLMCHADDRKFECDQCDKKFNNKRYLTSHKQVVHRPKSHVCSYCSKAFSTLSNLIRHVRIHTGEKPYPCCFCSYSCNAQYNIVKHIQLIHQYRDFTYKDYLKHSKNPPKPNNITTNKQDMLTPKKTSEYTDNVYSVLESKDNSESLNTLNKTAQEYKDSQVEVNEINTDPFNNIETTSFCKTLSCREDLDTTTDSSLLEGRQCQLLIDACGVKSTTSISDKLDIDDEVSHLDILIDTNSQFLTEEPLNEIKSELPLSGNFTSGISQPVTLLDAEEYLSLQIRNVNNINSNDNNQEKDNLLLQDSNCDNLLITVDDQSTSILNDDRQNLNNFIILANENDNSINFIQNKESLDSLKKINLITLPVTTANTTNVLEYDATEIDKEGDIDSKNDKLIIYTNTNTVQTQKPIFQTLEVEDINSCSILDNAPLVKINSNIFVMNYNNKDHISCISETNEGTSNVLNDVNPESVLNDACNNEVILNNAVVLNNEEPSFILTGNDATASVFKVETESIGTLSDNQILFNNVEPESVTATSEDHSFVFNN